MNSNYVDDLVDDDEIPELTKEDFDQMVPFSKLPAEMQQWLLGLQRGNVTIRPDEEKVTVPQSPHGHPVA